MTSPKFMCQVQKKKCSYSFRTIINRNCESGFFFCVLYLTKDNSGLYRLKKQDYILVLQGKKNNGATISRDL